MKILFFLATLIYLFDSVFYTANAQCKAWQHQSGLGGTLQGTNRTCADPTGQIFIAEICEPDNYLCSVQETISGSENCTLYEEFPWKANLPPGDDCNGTASCYSGTTCSTIDQQSRCIGKEENTTCVIDNECQPGLFCWHTGSGRTNTCRPVLQEGETCDLNRRCEFGTQCANLTCTRFGTLEDGERFAIYDGELYPTIPDTDVLAIYRLCENFWAFDTGSRVDNTHAIYECSKGPEKNFDDYGTSDAGFLCTYNLTANNGTVIRNITETPKCGFNTDTDYYCPMRRGVDDFSNRNLVDRATWRSSEDFNNSTTVCHHRTSIQYCIHIQESFFYQKAFNSAILNEWLTTGDNYPMIAENDKNVGNAITKTRDYWRIVDSSFTTNLSCFTAILTLIATVLYL
jgi:hypothetical protein